MKGVGGAGVKLRGIWCAGCAAGVRTDLHYPLSSGSLPRITGEGELGVPRPHAGLRRRKTSSSS